MLKRWINYEKYFAFKTAGIAKLTLYFYILFNYRQFVGSRATQTVGQKYLGISCLGMNLNGRPCRGKLYDTVVDWEDDRSLLIFSRVLYLRKFYYIYFIYAYICRFDGLFFFKS